MEYYRLLSLTFKYRILALVRTLWRKRSYQRQEGANIERTSACALVRPFARSLLHPLPVMHDAMLLTLYAHRNNPIFLLRHCHPLPPPPSVLSTPPSRTSSIRPRLFISIYFDHQIPHLYPSASSRPVTRQRTSRYVVLLLQIILRRCRSELLGFVVVYDDWRPLDRGWKIIPLSNVDITRVKSNWLTFTFSLKEDLQKYIYQKITENPENVWK